MTLAPVIGVVLAIVAFAAAPPPEAAEELDARRLLGKAHYENAETPPQFEPAAREFRRCIELAPNSAVDRFNLGLTLMRAEKFEEALQTLNEARRLDPELLAATYVTGIVYKRLSRFEEAIDCLEQVAELNPRCAGAYYNLGVCFKQLKQREQAVAAFKRAVELRPTHPSYHYQLMILYRDLGEVDNVKRHKETFDRVKDTIDESEKTAEALERSQYSYILEVAKLTEDLVPNPAAKVRFADATAGAGLGPPVESAPPPPLPALLRRDRYREPEVRDRYVPSVGSAVSLGDFDSDGDLDIYVVNCASDPQASANRLYRNEGGWRFADVTAAFGVGDAQMGTAAIFGDYDHDGNEDLYVVNHGPNVLYRKRGDGVFEVSGLEAEGDLGRAVVRLSDPLPGTVEVGADVESVETAEHKSNAFLIFDYQGPEDFRYAGADMEDGCWIIGHYDGSWVQDARTDEGLNTNQRYILRLRLEGSVASLVVVQSGSDVEKAAHDFGRAVTGGRVGLAADHAVTRFDNVFVRAPAGGEAPRASWRVLYEEDFKDGVADGLEEIGGTWKVVDWGYEDVSQRTQVQEPQFGRQAIFVDYDHDNDLDIFVVNDVDLGSPPDRETFAVPGDLSGQFNTLLGNNGNTFSVRTDEAGLLVDCAQSRGVLFTDFDGDSDTDLFVVNADAPSTLFANARMGKFEPGGSFSPPLGRHGRAAAERDFNRDGTPDLLFAVENTLYLYVNDGQANFTGTPVDLPEALAAGGVGRIDVLDYNNDGWADLLLAAADGRTLSLLAGAGRSRFQDVSSRVGLDGFKAQIAGLAIGDLDGDGDEDLVLLTRDRGLRLLRNDGGEQAHWINVRLVGKKVNRNGYGALVEIAGGGHYQKQTVSDGRVHFGLGDLEGLDIVRVTWPNGQAQNVVRPAIDTDAEIVQYVKVSASCGFLYAWNGERFELVNEILGIGPLGVPMEPGVYYPLDCTELTKIEASELVPAGGFYELRLTEELREITYADQITLRVVDHPAELEVIPNEMFTTPPFPEDKFFAVADQRPPVSALDDRGTNVRPLILARDGRVPTFPLTRYDGLARPHSLTLDLGDLSGAAHIMLYLDSWIYWAESSVGMAIAQDPRFELTPLTLEVRDQSGGWRTAIEWVGLPTSKGMVVPVDLTGRFLCDDYHVRLSTNLRVYFDRIFVSTDDRADRCRQTELPVAVANLHYRGFSRMTRDALGFERFNYAEVSLTGSWNPPKGMFTRYGDVTPLLAEADDMYVIFGPGDELTMRFDARGLPKLPPGWTRDFVFYANGWVKDGDLNTKFSDTVTPLPFHGMSGYPYGANEHYPDTPAHRAYQRQYNTRPARATVGELPRGTRAANSPSEPRTEASDSPQSPPAGRGSNRTGPRPDDPAPAERDREGATP